MLDNRSSFNSVPVCRSPMRVYLSGFLALFSAFHFGISLTLTSSLFEKLSKDGILNSVDIGSACSMLPLFALIASLAHGYFPLALTTKLQIGSLLYSAGFFSLLEGSKPLLHVSKALSGLGVGLTTACVPLYCCAIAPQRLSSLFGQFLPLGIVSGILAGVLFSHFTRNMTDLMVPNMGIALIALAHAIAFFLALKPNNPEVQATKTSKNKANTKSLNQRRTTNTFASEKDNINQTSNHEKTRYPVFVPEDSQNPSSYNSRTPRQYEDSNHNAPMYGESQNPSSYNSRTPRQYEDSNHNAPMYGESQVGYSRTTSSDASVYVSSASIEEFDETIDSSVEESSKSQSHTSVGQLLKNKRAFKSNCILAGAHIAQQLSFINGVIILLNDLLQKYDDSRYLAAAGVYTAALVSTAVAFTISQKVGRKPLLCGSAGVAGLGLLLMCWGKFNLLAAMIFTIGFNFGLGPVVWTLTAEIYPEKYQQPAATLGASINWASNFSVVMATGFLTKTLGKYVYLVFGLATIASGAAFLCTLEETKGRPAGLL